MGGSSRISRRDLIVKGTLLAAGAASGLSTGRALARNRTILGIGGSVAQQFIHWPGMVLSSWVDEEALLSAATRGIQRVDPGVIHSVQLGCPSCKSTSSFPGWNRFHAELHCANPDCKLHGHANVLPGKLLTAGQKEARTAAHWRKQKQYFGAASPIRGDIVCAKYSGVGVYCNTDVTDSDLLARPLDKGEGVVYLGIYKGTHNTLHVYDPVEVPEKRFLFADARSFYRQRDGQALRVNTASKLSGSLNQVCTDNSTMHQCS